MYMKGCEIGLMVKQLYILCMLLRLVSINITSKVRSDERWLNGCHPTRLRQTRRVKDSHSMRSLFCMLFHYAMR